MTWDQRYSVLRCNIEGCPNRFATIRGSVVATRAAAAEYGWARLDAGDLCPTHALWLRKES